MAHIVWPSGSPSFVRFATVPSAAISCRRAIPDVNGATVNLRRVKK
jgi:hypothetical protein